jgi:hypothetical protein
VETPNNPNCRVSWRYHVTPVVLVQDAGEHALDPSMFDRPVPTSDWVAAQNDSGAALRHSDSSVYYRPPSGQPVQVDPDYSDTIHYLGVYRLKLIERIAKVGAPPYAHCRP